MASFYWTNEWFVCISIFHSSSFFGCVFCFCLLAWKFNKIFNKCLYTSYLISLQGQTTTVKTKPCTRQQMQQTEHFHLHRHEHQVTVFVSQFFIKTYRPYSIRITATKSELCYFVCSTFSSYIFAEFLLFPARVLEAM